MYAWFIKPMKDNPVILHFHGQAESILSHQDVALYCLEKGFGLYMISYRGHYKSGGKPTERGLYNDAQAAIFELKKLGVDVDKIFLWGHSLGTAVALETALHNQVQGVILQSPIKEIKSAAIDLHSFYSSRMHMNIIGYFIKNNISKMNFIQKMDNISKIKNLKCPILILHSKTDRIAPYQNAIDLADNSINAKVFISESGSHWDVNWCFDKVFEFINSLDYDKVRK